MLLAVHFFDHRPCKSMSDGLLRSMAHGISGFHPSMEMYPFTGSGASASVTSRYTCS